MNENDAAVGSAGAAKPAHRLAFDAFCETHERAWHGLARARLRSDVRALQAVAAMKAHLWRTWGIALRQAVPATYAWGLIKSHIADAVAEVILETGRVPGGPLADWAEAVRYFADQARISLETLDDHEDLYEAILCLAERQYDIVVLRYLLGLKDVMIAEYLGITETNVRTTAHQALRKLRRLLGVRTGGEEE